MTFCISPTRLAHWIGLASLLTALFMMPTAAGADRCPVAFQPFKAHYDLYRDGERLGTTTVTLSRDADGAWRYALSSEAEKGVFGLLGAGYQEASYWMPAGERLLPLRFERKQQVAFSERKYQAHFDWSVNRAWGRARDREWEIGELPRATVDRLLVNLALIRDLRCGRESLSYEVLEKGRLETWRFNRLGESSETTPIGNFEAVKVAKHHDDPERESLSWHAPALDWLAVRIEHQDDADEDRFALVLRELER